LVLFIYLLIYLVTCCAPSKLVLDTHWLMSSTCGTAHNGWQVCEPGAGIVPGRI
jgi:hypothetical protein